jgi:SSS family solute:Na+ symporter
MFNALAHAKPDHLVMPGTTKDLGHVWFVSTVLMTSLAFFMWPQYIGACYSAKDRNTLRRNAVIMPLYSITVPLVFIVGFTALLVLPNLTNGDLALLSIVCEKPFRLGSWG